MRQPGIRLILAGLALAVGFSSHSEMRFTVLAGAGGYVRPDAMTPVQLIVANDDANRQGSVTAAFTVFGKPACWAVHAVPLPPAAKKSVFLYLPPCRDPDGIVVQYRDKRGRTVAETSERVTVLAGQVPVLAAVHTIPRGLPEKRYKNSPIYHPLILRADQLADRHEGLEMFDAVILSPPPVDPFPLDQTAALRGWVLRGGTLVVDASRATQAFTDRAFADLLPFVPRRLAEVPAGTFPRAITVAAGPVVEGELLLESGGRPLIIRRNYGLGSVVCFAFEPDLPVFARDYPGREALWQNVLGAMRLEAIRTGLADAGQLEPLNRLGPHPYGSRAAGFAGAMVQLVTVTPSAGLRLGLILLLMALYALAAGPGDYYLVRRLGRPSLTWVTFPIIVTVFTTAAYAGARLWIGGEMATKNLRRLVVCQDRRLALRYDVAGLFVPEGKDYDIRADNEGLLRPLTGQRVVGPDGGIRLYQDANVIVQRIPIWTYRTYAAADIVKTYPDVRLTVDGAGDERAITVANESEQPLSGMRLITQDAIFRLPIDTLEPGETASLSMDAMSRMPLRNAGAAQGDALAGLGALGPVPWAEGREFDIRDALRRGAFVFYARNAGTAPCPLEIDGYRSHAAGERALLIVTYEEPPL